MGASIPLAYARCLTPFQLGDGLVFGPGRAARFMFDQQSSRRMVRSVSVILNPSLPSGGRQELRWGLLMHL